MRVVELFGDFQVVDQIQIHFALVVRDFRVVDGVDLTDADAHSGQLDRRVEQTLGDRLIGEIVDANVPDLPGTAGQTDQDADEGGRLFDVEMETETHPASRSKGPLDEKRVRF